MFASACERAETKPCHYVHSFGNSWLFNYPPGGGIAYFGEHCVTDDGPATELETTMLKNYVNYVDQGEGNAVLGSPYLLAQQTFYGNHVNDVDALKASDYHSIPRLYLGWMNFHGDPSLRLPGTVRLPGKIGSVLQNPVIIEAPGGLIEIIPGDEGPPIIIKERG